MHEITHLVEALNHVSGQALAILDNDALTEFARLNRGISKAQWFAWREENAAEIFAFIETPQAQWCQRWQLRPAKSRLSLAAWQLSQEMLVLLGQLREDHDSVNRLDPAWLRQLAAESVLSQLVSRRAAVLWPGQIGSPFAD